jgi:hypothetical protein
MKELDIKKIYGETTAGIYETIKQMVKSQSLLLDAILIMQSAVEYPEDLEYTIERMQKFVDQFTKS